MRVGDLSEEELPQLGQILSMLLQHTPLHSQLLANTALLQEIIQNLTVNTAHTWNSQRMDFKTFVQFGWRDKILLMEAIQVISLCMFFRGIPGVQPGSSGWQTCSTVIASPWLMGLPLAVETWAFETCTDWRTHRTDTWCVAQFPSQTSYSDFETKAIEYIQLHFQTGIQWSDMFFLLWVTMNTLHSCFKSSSFFCLKLPL